MSHGTELYPQQSSLPKTRSQHGSTVEGTACTTTAKPKQRFSSTCPFRMLSMLSVLSGQWNRTFSKNSSWKGQGQANACGPQIFTECSSGNVKAKRSSFHNFIIFHHSSVASKPAFWLSCIHLWHVSSEIRWARLCARLPMTATLKWYRMISTLLFLSLLSKSLGIRAFCSANPVCGDTAW